MSTALFDRLYVGLIVHHVARTWSNDAGRHNAAIVTRIVNRDAGQVHLVVFNEGALGNAISTGAKNVNYSAAHDPGTWHFIETPD